MFSLLLLPVVPAAAAVVMRRPERGRRRVRRYRRGRQDVGRPGGGAGEGRGQQRGTVLGAWLVVARRRAGEVGRAAVMVVVVVVVAVNVAAAAAAVATAVAQAVPPAVVSPVEPAETVAEVAAVGGRDEPPGEGGVGELRVRGLVYPPPEDLQLHDVPGAERQESRLGDGVAAAVLADRRRRRLAV